MRSIRLIMMFATFILPLALPAGSLAAKNPQQQATESLAAKNISVNSEGFIKEVISGNAENVQLFLTAGYFAGSQDEGGTSALMAALNAPTGDIFALLLSTLPKGSAAAPVLNLRNKEGNTALHLAISKKQEQQAMSLIDQGATVSLTNGADVTPLMLATQLKLSDTVKAIIAADKSTVTATDSKGNTALTYAIRAATPEIVQLLLEAGASASAADSIGITPLMLAARAGNEATIKLLLDNGADVTSVTKSGESALTIAASKGFTAIASLLMENIPAGSVLVMPALASAMNAEKVDAALFETLLSKLGTDEVVPPTLIFTALERKQGNAVRLLVARLKDVNQRDASNDTLFFKAVDAGYEDVALDLIARGAEITQSGASGTSTLSRAVRHNMPKVVKLLLDNGASADQKTSEGYTLAEMCVYSGYPETLEVLLARGVKIDREFALLWSIRDGKGKAAPVLLAHGAVADIMNQDGTPAITLAAEAGQLEAVKGFIAHKATLDYPSKSRGITALGSAALGGHLEVVKALVEAGASLEKTDKGGMTALAQAASLSRLAVVEYLLSKGANSKAIDVQKRSVIDIASSAPASADREKVIQILASSVK